MPSRVEMEKRVLQAEQKHPAEKLESVARAARERDLITPEQFAQMTDGAASSVDLFVAGEAMAQCGAADKPIAAALYWTVSSKLKEQGNYTLENLKDMVTPSNWAVLARQLF